MPDQEGTDRVRPSPRTRAEEREDAQTPPGADRPPTAAEEAAAEGNELDPAVEEHEREMLERGAHQQGEGRVP